MSNGAAKWAVNSGKTCYGTLNFNSRNSIRDHIFLLPKLVILIHKCTYSMYCDSAGVAFPPYYDLGCAFNTQV